MTIGRKSIIAALMTGSMALGALVGAAAFAGGSAANAATTTGQATAPRAAASPTGTFVSNEDPAHEATESAAREAQEDAGQRPSVP